VVADGLQYWAFKTLHMLRRGGAPYRATPGALATQLGLSPTAMTNRLDALERLGYVRRELGFVAVTTTKPYVFAP
jgi:DNA-binding MarR family transcriptional regulator